MLKAAMRESIDSRRRTSDAEPVGAPKPPHSAWAFAPHWRASDLPFALGIATVATVGSLGALSAAQHRAARHGLLPPDDAEDAAMRTAYAATFGALLVVVLGSATKSLATTSRGKRDMSARLVLHYLPICIAMLACAMGLVYVPRGPGGHANMAMQMGR
jgi:hypothetical protein